MQRSSPHVPGSGTSPARRPAAGMRIGDVARSVGTTPRTIRYYEEIGLLPPAPARASGRHRTYSAQEVERLREVMRLRDLLGVSLEELKTLLAAEEARAAVRAQPAASLPTPLIPAGHRARDPRRLQRRSRPGRCQEGVSVPDRAEVKPSPHGVPGAVTDPELVEAFDLAFAGAQGARVNGYLA